MSKTGRSTTLMTLVDELESALPAIRELADVQARLASARQAEKMALQAADLASTSCSRTEADCAGKIREAEANRDKRIAEADQEIQRRSAESRAKYESWQVTAKATKAREEEESIQRQEALRAMNEQIAEKSQELEVIEGRLKTARQAVKSALSEVA